MLIGKVCESVVALYTMKKEEETNKVKLFLCTSTQPIAKRFYKNKSA